MGRFSKIDFDEAPRPAPATAEVWPDLDAAACLKQGDERFDSGLYEEALTAYSRALRFNKDLVEAWVGQLRCLIQMREWPEALTWCDRAQERFPKSADVLACKGLVLVLSDEKTQGMEFLDGAVEMRSPSAWVWLSRGEALLHTKEGAPNAARCFLKAVELSAESATEWRSELRAGIALNRAHRFAQARRWLQSAVRRAPHNPLVLYHNGLMHEGLGEMELAIGFFERALVARRNFSEAHDALQRARSVNPIAKLWRKMTR